MGKQSYNREGLYQRLREQKVTETFGICRYVAQRRKCMSRKYVSYSDFVRIPNILGNDECQVCWDKNAGTYTDI